MANVTREPISNLHERISVKIDKEDYLPDFEKDIRTYSKKANIPGFRKGMVPAGMIKKMYGQEFYKDSVIKSVEKELQKFLIEEKLEIFGQPLPAASQHFPDLNMQHPQEYEFQFEVGLKPDIKIDLGNAGKIFKYKVKVKPEDIDKRIGNFQAQFGELKETESVTSENNVLNVTITQTDAEGSIAEKGINSDETLYVKVFTDDTQKELMGKRKDDELKGKLNQFIDPEKYPSLFENIGVPPKDEDKVAIEVVMKIKAVNDLENHPLNEELYRKAFPNEEIKSEEEFRNAIEASEQKQWDATAKNFLEHEVHHILLDTPVDLPEDFLKRLVENSENEKTPEDIEAQVHSLVGELKWSLVSQQIIRDQDIKVSSEEIKDEMKKELSQYFGNVDLDTPEYAWAGGYVTRMMGDKEQVESRYNRIAIQKILNWAISELQPAEKAISQEDFKELLEKHQHAH